MHDIQKLLGVSTGAGVQSPGGNGAPAPPVRVIGVVSSSLVLGGFRDKGGERWPAWACQGLGAGSHTYLGGHGVSRWSQPLGIKLELHHPQALGPQGHSLTSPSLSFLVCKAVTVRLEGAKAQGAFGKDTGVRFAVTPGHSDDQGQCPGCLKAPGE